MAMAIGMMREVTSAMHGISKMINLGCFLTLEFLLMTHIDLSIQVEGTERDLETHASHPDWKVDSDGHPI